MFPRYLQYLLTDFRQTFVIGSSLQYLLTYSECAVAIHVVGGMSMVSAPGRQYGNGVIN